ncbi:hypothetical protein [Xanthomonas translucens]|nr:hypothetical protein [Xanthomonas translucens]QSQ49157.1 hypothetical protein ISN35_00155 [Xanthomonas translucens pv. undulosa]QSQ51560.1 hypothetical protein ISN36_12320 [Xanthomonas translucens pv. undulosa]WLA00103.1 hypothetical protein MO330_14750 [Xanthomonas translucens]WLA03877.1 hypothetical protein MO329_14655 [Xanthomonas translucens]WLA16973.1 hypothetical protein MO326_05505 [Xanthomonas translucens]
MSRHKPGQRRLGHDGGAIDAGHAGVDALETRLRRPVGQSRRSEAVEGGTAWAEARRLDVRQRAPAREKWNAQQRPFRKRARILSTSAWKTCIAAAASVAAVVASATTCKNLTER